MPAENLSREPFLVHPFYNVLGIAVSSVLLQAQSKVNLLVHTAYVIFVVYASRHDLSCNQ